MGGAVAELGFVKHHAGKEGAEGKRDIKQLHGAEGDAQRRASTDRVNSSREPVAALRDMIHGTSRRPTSIIMAIKATTLPMVIPRSRAGTRSRRCLSPPYRQSPAAGPASGPSPVFHNQPADGDLPALAVNQLSFLQRAQHYGTGGGEAQAKDDAGHQRPAEGGGERHTQQRRHGYLGDSPGMAIDFTAIRSLSENAARRRTSAE